MASRVITVPTTHPIEILRSAIGTADGRDPCNTEAISKLASNAGIPSRAARASNCRRAVYLKMPPVIRVPTSLENAAATLGEIDRIAGPGPTQPPTPFPTPCPTPLATRRTPRSDAASLAGIAATRGASFLSAACRAAGDRCFCARIRRASRR